MAWARVDDAFDDHPKVLALLDHEHGVAAVGLWALTLTWANRNTRKPGKIPGRIPSHLPRRYAGPIARELAALLVAVPPGFTAGLWEPAEDGWQIHDFSQYLPSEEVRAKKSAAGARGAAVRWGNRVSAGTDGTVPSTDGKQDGSANGTPMANHGKPVTERNNTLNDRTGGQGDGTLPYPDGTLPSVCHDQMANGMAPDGRAMAIPIPIPDIEGSDEPSIGGASGEAPQTKTSRGTRIPDDFAVTPAMVAWAYENCPGVDGRTETTKFINHYVSKTGQDATRRDWVRTWQNWMLNARDRYGHGRAPNATARRSPDDRVRGHIESGRRVQAILDQQRGAS
ncbi:MAG TPA: hypothetical protein VFQ44_02435 [Streptosporangiaceae bacterium]|nr:hypothetical protein [Streptosporangiaceae bacterium]